jgi:hypothetical protein
LVFTFWSYFFDFWQEPHRVACVVVIYSAHFLVYCWSAPHSQALSKLVCKWFKDVIKHLGKTIIIDHIAVIDLGF